MNAFRIISLFFLCWIPCLGFGQMLNSILFINEISQGIQDSQEYVEFIVLGSPGCSSVTSIDIRGFILDDNNGEYLPATSPGANISNGAIRFSNIPFWQNIPQGTIIVIYNELDRNPAIPPDDFSMSDGNGRLILPASSSLLEGQSSSPSGTSTNATGPWVSGGGLWEYVSMENDGDTFRAKYYPGVPYFQAVSWGTNIGSPQISDSYFPGPATGLVFYADANPGTGDMNSGPATTSQTPGFPNTPQNAQYILDASGINPPLQITSTIFPESCFNTCDAGIYAEVTGGTGPYAYSWNVPSSGNVSTVQNLCPGTYTVTATDLNGCIITSAVTIEPAEELIFTITQTNETCTGACDGTASIAVSGGYGAISVNWAQGVTGAQLTDLCPNFYSASIEDANGCTTSLELIIEPAPLTPNSVFITSGPFLESDSPVQMENSISGGIYTTADCSGCLTPEGIFDPSIAGEGTYEICYSLSNGNCPSMNCATFVVNPCVLQLTSEVIYICEGDSVLIFGEWASQPDLFSHTFQGTNCDSLHKITLLFHNAPDINIPVHICEDDSVFIFGSWIDTAGIYGQEMLSAQGCAYMNYFTITESFCPEEPVIYIPNSFTPNGDQINDFFRVEMTGATIQEGFIVNRWGEITARFDSENLIWNGNNEKGGQCPDGVYTYLIRYSTIDGISDQITGHVTLLR